MFEQFLSAMRRPTALSGLEYAQQMTQCSLQLTQSQMDVSKRLCAEVDKEYRKALASTDPAVIAKQWPELMATAMRANAEAGALFMKNAREYQDAVLAIVQRSTPTFPATMMQDMVAVVNGATAPLANGRESMQAARTKKAA